MNLPVELITGGRRIRAVSQDLSSSGMFVRVHPEALPAGTIAQVVISPFGQPVVTTCTVTHVLGDVEARVLSRSPGVGVAFRGGVRRSDEVFHETIQRLLARHATERPTDDLRIVVADAQTRLLERLSTALDVAGFAVATATNGMEALGACLTRTPDVVLVERDMPVVDGLHVLQEMGRHTELAGVPVMVMSETATDLIRLQAFQLGAVDFIPKPFTVLEIILRARRWARTARRETERVVLRGALAELGLPSLLTMFEQEKKTGQLAVTRDQLVAWIEFADGRIVRARSSELDADSRTVLMNVLDWKHGYFELSSSEPKGPAELDASVTHLLLEHARLSDELARS